MRTVLILLLALVIAAAQSLPASAAVAMGDVTPGSAHNAHAQAELCATKAGAPKASPGLAFRHCAKGQAKHGLLPCDPVRGVLAEIGFMPPPPASRELEHLPSPRLHSRTLETFLRPPRLRA